MASMMGELGTTGLSEFSGIIQEEFLRELRGREGYKRYNEMRKNSPVIRALLTSIELSIRKVSWNFVDRTVEDGQPSERVDLCNLSRDNMSTSWNDFIVEALTMLPFGFSLFEIVYERVGGNILWRKFAPRGQDTVYRWLFDEAGGLAGFTQQAIPTYRLVDIPIEKLLLFRTRVERNNPEGESILRAAWIPYYYAKHIQQIEAIGIERDLAGMPVIYLPASADTSDAPDSDLSRAMQMVRNVRNDEQSGLVIPEGWTFELTSTGGSRTFDTDKIIRRYESRMLMAALAQFLLLGQDSVGSLALSRDLSDFFTMAVDAVADIIAETFTKYAIPRLLKLNGYDAEGIELQHTPAGDVDITAIADAIQKVGGNLTWGAEEELWLRQIIGMPERDVEELRELREQKEQEKMERAQMFRDRMAGGGEERRDENTITLYASGPSDPPDDARRRRLERKFERAIQKHLDRQKKKVMRFARSIKR